MTSDRTEPEKQQDCLETRCQRRPLPCAYHVRLWRDRLQFMRAGEELGLGDDDAYDLVSRGWIERQRQLPVCWTYVITPAGHAALAGGRAAVEK